MVTLKRKIRMEMWRSRFSPTTYKQTSKMARSSSGRASKSVIWSPSSMIRLTIGASPFA